MNPRLLLLAGACALGMTTGGTVHAASRSLGDLSLGSADSFGLDYNSSFPAVYLDGNAYFAIGCHLWKTNGLPAGTSVVTTDSPAGSCTIGGLLALNGGVLFMRGAELWRSDGTAAGTAKLTVAGFGASSTDQSLGAWQGRPGLGYVQIVGGSGHEVWATDGTAGGTIKLLGTAASTSVAFMPDHSMVILANGLWRAVDNLSPATSIASGFTAFSNTAQPTVVGNKLVFRASEAMHGNEPWVSDLSGPGTQLLKDVVAGSADSDVGFGPVVNGQLYFKGYDYLWKTDGTPANTVALTVAGQVIVQKEIAAIGNAVVFPGKLGDGKFYWWRSDGTVPGTAQLVSTPMRDSTSNPVVWFAQRSNDALYCTFGPYPYKLLRVTGLVEDSSEIPVCDGQLADERRHYADTDLVATTSGLLALRDAKPRATLLPYPPSTYSETHPGLPGGPMFYFTQKADLTGREPWSMDLTDADVPVCSDPGKAVPDNNATGRTDTLYFPQVQKAGRLRVHLDIPHSYVGDLVATLTHVESGKSVQLFNRPGAPVVGANGCPSNDLDIVLDDAAAAVVGDGCSPADGNPAYPRGTVLRPLQPLGTFAGDDLTGTWQLKVADVFNGDRGGIQRWCLQNIDRLFFDDFQN